MRGGRQGGKVLRGKLGPWLESRSEWLGRGEQGRGELGHWGAMSGGHRQAGGGVARTPVPGVPDLLEHF